MKRAWALALALAAAPLGVARAEAPPETATASAAEAEAFAPPRERNPEEAERIRQMEDGASGGADEPAPKTLGGQLLQTFFMLIAICALAYLTLGKLLPRVLGMSVTGRRALVGAPPSGLLQVVDRLALDPRRAIMVVKVGDEHYLVGVSDQGMTRLARLDGSTFPAPPADKPLFGTFGRLLERRLDKEST